MNTFSKRILIAVAIIFVLILSMLTAEGETSLLFTRFGIVGLISTLLFVTLVVIFSSKPKK